MSDELLIQPALPTLEQAWTDVMHAISVDYMRKCSFCPMLSGERNASHDHFWKCSGCIECGGSSDDIALSLGIADL